MAGLREGRQGEELHESDGLGISRFKILNSPASGGTPPDGGGKLLNPN